MAGTDFLDYGWRNYDAFMVRWLGIDKLTEKYYNQSPYNFVGNNPIAHIELDGMDWYYIVKKNEETKKWYREYHFTTKYFSQEDVQKAGIPGIYAGKRDEYAGVYYSLLGAAVPSNVDGLHNFTYDIIQHLDDAIVAENRASKEESTSVESSSGSSSVNFTIEGLNTRRTSMRFNYGGGEVDYDPRTKNTKNAALNWGTGEKKSLHGWMIDKGEAHRAIVNRTEGSGIVLTWTFDSKEAWQIARDLINKLLNN